MSEATAIRRGRGDNPQPIRHSDEVFTLRGCPECGGRGWFLINPFATGGTNGAGGLANMTQCLTCLDSKAYYDLHGKLPPEIQAAMETPEPRP